MKKRTARILAGGAVVAAAITILTQPDTQKSAPEITHEQTQAAIPTQPKPHTATTPEPVTTETPAAHTCSAGCKHHTHQAQVTPTASEQHTTTAPIQAFQSWLDNYTKQPEQANLHEGIQLAQARKQAIKQLIIDDPRQAVEAALSPRQLETLPPEITAELETVVTDATAFYGQLAICHDHIDEHHNENCQIIDQLHTSDGKSYEAHLYGQRANISSKDNLPVFGVAVEDQIAISDRAIQTYAAHELPSHITPAADEIPLRIGQHWFFADSQQQIANLEEQIANLEATNNPDMPVISPKEVEDINGVIEAYADEVADNSWATGEKNVIVVLVSPSDNPTWTNPPTQEDLELQLAQLNPYYLRTSYGKNWFGPIVSRSYGNVPLVTVTAHAVLPENTSYYYNSFSALRSACSTVMSAQGYTYTDFDRVVCMSNANMTSSTGRAYVGARFSWTNNSLSGGTAAHELGHNNGAQHAHFWETNSLPRDASGTLIDYGDPTCLMAGTALHDFNVLEKERFTWLSDSEGSSQPITTSGTYRVYDHTHEDSNNATSRLRSLRIPIEINLQAGVDKNLWVSFRHTEGTQTWAESNRNGVQLTASDLNNNGRGSYLLDTTVNSDTNVTIDRYDHALTLGRTYSEIGNVNGTFTPGELHITPIARGSDEVNGNTHEWVEVDIRIGSSGTNNAPTAVISSVDTVAPGNPLALSATSSSDPDGDTLAYYWQFGDGTISMDNQATQNKTWANSGFYEVTLTVSDRKGGTSTATKWINVGNLPYLAPESVTGLSTGLNYRYSNISSYGLPDFDTIFPASEGNIANASLSIAQRNDDFAIEYTGYIDIAQRDVYTFSTVSEDSSQVWVGGQLVVDNNGDRASAQSAEGNVALNAGMHTIRILFNNRDRTESLNVYWKSPSVNGGNEQALPDSVLYRKDDSQRDRPTVTLTAPSDNSSYNLGDTITLTATASDGDGIANVQFFIDGSLHTQDTTAPYETDVISLHPGAHTVTAIAYDQSGEWQKSSTIGINVADAGLRRSIGINFKGAAPDEDNMLVTDSTGAMHLQSNWSNLSGQSGSQSNLIDSTGASTSASVIWSSDNPNGNNKNLGNLTSPAGRLMRGAIMSRQDRAPATATVSGITYSRYDVYVYFDTEENDGYDDSLYTYTIGSDTRYAQSSITANDGIGDFPTHDGWFGFKEATATSASASQNEQLGNYVAFRNLSGSSFTLNTGSASGSGEPTISGIQIVEDDGTPLNPPDAPTSLTATVSSDTSISLSWTDNATNELGFRLESSSDGVNWSLLDTLGADTTSYPHSSLLPGTTYHYRVKAYNNDGDSAYSNTDNATTTGAAPIILEAESLTRRSSSDNTTVLTDTAASNGERVQVTTGTGQGQWVEFDISGINAGTYELTYQYWTWDNRAIEESSFNGTSTGSTFNQYGPRDAAAEFRTSAPVTLTIPDTGTHTIRFTAFDKQTESNGYTLSFDYFTLVSTSTPTTGYQNWLDTQFSSTDLNNSAKETTLWGVNADPDGDSVGNFLEYALGGDPNTFEANLQPSLTVNGSNLEFTFMRAQASVTYTIEQSSDLTQSWSTRVTDPGSTGQSVTVTIPLTEFSGGKLYFRLMATE